MSFEIPIHEISAAIDGAATWKKTCEAPHTWTAEHDGWRLIVCAFRSTQVGVTDEVCDGSATKDNMIVRLTPLLAQQALKKARGA